MLVMLTGCGPDREPVYPVRGQVLYQGKPAEHAFVVFHPKDASEEAQKLRPHGRADSDGCFHLTTFTQGDGAPAGGYNVTIVLPGPPPGTDPNDLDPETAMLGPDVLEGRYGNAATTPLTATVAKGKNNLPPFELE